MHNVFFRILFFIIAILYSFLTINCSHHDWIVLFDGSSVDAWRGFNRYDFPETGWVIVDGTLKTIPKSDDDSSSTVDKVDIIIKERFSSFELELE